MTTSTPCSATCCCCSNWTRNRAALQAAKSPRLSTEGSKRRGPSPFGSGWPLRGRLLGILLGLGRGHPALQGRHLGAELAVVGAQQGGVDAAIVLDRLYAARGEPQADGMSERIRQDRGDLQVRHEPAP